MLRMLFIFCVAIGSFSACTMNRKIALQDSVDNYVKALSRGDENMALSFVAPEKRAQYFLNAEKMQSLQISQAEVKTIYPDEKLENALVTIFLEYFPASEMNVITEKRRLTWKYNEKAEAWYLDETKPFGRP